ncbi:MAG TPA: M23 family metallopeptidase [Gaiella sp.]|nr:M23 family metallopeptidase [Gaiella sp.]
MRSARAPLVLVLALGVLVAGVAGAAPDDSTATTTGATALVASVTLPGQPASSTGQLEAPPTASAGGPFSYPEDGSALRIGASSASVTAQAGTSSSAEGTVRAIGVSLLGGEIVADTVSIRAGAAAGVAGATADVGSSEITGLVVLGQPVGTTTSAQLPLADWGTLDVLVSTSSTAPGTPRSGSSSITGIRVRLISEHNGLPAGSEIVVGAATAEAVAVPTPAAPIPHGTAGGGGGADKGGGAVAGGGATTGRQLPGQRPASAPRPAAHPSPSAPREPGRSIPGVPPELVKPAPEVTARLSQGGYVFPLFGPAAFGDTFGAFRGDVAGKWHHGEDIVAPLGTPVLAVADGTLFSVGWNDIGGWRLWLRDRAGNEFYYAHLSAYSPIATDGRTVRAGEVLGFVGNSGDADGGVTHLHFEIHPVDLVHLGYDGAVAPYPFLVAWRRADDVSFATGRQYVPTAGGAAPVALARAGAVLLESTDISASSGLVPGALKRALASREARPNRTP